MHRIALNILVFLVLTGAARAEDRIVLPTGVEPVHYDVAVTPDAAHATFTGEVRVTLTVTAPTRTIKLNAADLAFQSATIAGAGKPDIAFNTTEETATLTFPRPVGRGEHTLAIAYSGKINPNGAGLFYLDYDTAQGKKRALFTQFENSDARRFIPSWDEPGRKATFTLTAIVPADEMAVSNMPAVATEQLPGGLKRVHFAQTPRMSSYLLFFALGDFERISRKVDGIDIGIVFRRGEGAKVQYALDSASRLLPYFENYFGVKYPLPKLDLVTGPGESKFFGAMENWGAIFMFESDLMLDKSSSEHDMRNVFVGIAHEMAHQWFGDLVTMQWWDDLWLNEGFASWMQLKAADSFYPQWHVWTDGENSKSQVMREDARTGTHPIVQHIRDVFQANQAFDDITYVKGLSVVSMLESFSGEDAFRAGLRTYIKGHLYGNTVSDDLWHALDKTGPAPVTEIAHDFTLQAGVPLIRVTATPTGLRLMQDRAVDDNSEQPATTWRVPVVVHALAGGATWRGFVSRNSPQDVTINGVVNAGQTGYFRTAYDEASFQPLAENFASLPPLDQLGLLNDARDNGYSGISPFSYFLRLANHVSIHTDPRVIDTLARSVGGIDELYRGLPGRTAYRKFALSVLNPFFANVGWDPKTGENPNIILLRGHLISVLSEMDGPAVVAEASRRFAAFVQNPDSLSGNMRQTVLSITARHANASQWDALHNLALKTQDAGQKTQFYTYLGMAEDDALAQKALQLSMSDEVPVTTRPDMVSVVSALHPEMAFDFLQAHLSYYFNIIEPHTRDGYPLQLVRDSFDPAIIAKIDSYADAHIPATARERVVKTKSEISYKTRIRSTYLPEIDAWLSRHPN